MRPCDNPFASHRVDALDFRPQGTSWAALLAHLDAIGGRGAIVGPHGSGKTTLLEALHRHLADRGMRVRLLRLEGLSRGTSSTETPAAGDAVLVDGADRLSSLGWARLKLAARRATALVVTSHRDGRLPVLHRCATSPALLAQLIGELLGEAPARHTRIARELYGRHCGDLRAALGELYDRAARIGVS